MDTSDGDLDSKLTKRRGNNDKENEVEGDGDIEHMKESQEQESAEPEPGPGGLAGLIANLSGVIYLKFQLFFLILQLHGTILCSLSLGCRWLRRWCCPR